MKNTIPSRYDHATISAKWQKIWADARVYEPNLDHPVDPYYNLMMFPYPSAEGLHVGNMYAFSGADIAGRFQRMNGHDVLEPIGLDGFGIHSENYAMKIGKHPAEQALVSEKHFYEQLQQIGNGFAWNERLETYDPEYYKWTQWLFIQMFKKGLAYKAISKVNWCPSCKTVLADEQVEDGVCERCKTVVERKDAKQWFFRITNYADTLLKNIEKLRWPEAIKIAQRQWIGKKEGVEIAYPIADTDEKITCFTTRPETNFGATFVVIAPEHELAMRISRGEVEIAREHQDEVKTYCDQALKKSEQQRLEDARKKTGAFTGLYAINKLNNSKMPIYVADFVLAGFGTGAVVGVPAHDLRDFEFAQVMELPIIRVVTGKNGDTTPVVDKNQVQEDDGAMINSAFLDGLEVAVASKKIIEYMVEKGWATRSTSYHLRDWLISRQRFWGPPIPMVECVGTPSCGWQPVPEDQLPVELPYIEEYKPMGDGKSPLEKAPESWLMTTCPRCGETAKRETDVSDTFLDSSWYFLRYPSLGSKTASTLAFDPERIKTWMPVSAYIGGAEHAVLHLLYARFVTIALHEWGLLSFDEPFPFLFGHGLIIKDGAKMSKSRGNVVNPDEYIVKFGADTLRTYLMFLGPYDQGGDFRDDGIAGMERWMQRVWRTVVEKTSATNPTTPALQKKLHQTIQKCTHDLGEFHYNTAIASMMECVNLWNDASESMSREDAMQFLCLLAPFAPYMTEELFQWLGCWDGEGEFRSIHRSNWPIANPQFLVQNDVSFVLQMNGKTKAVFTVPLTTARSQERIETFLQSQEKTKQVLRGAVPKKTVFVPEKLINYVI
ncbi:MAG: Leucine-tRNA ligase [Microgenomates group bacterium GW2011_GWF2_45_18]|nr:MAG: Leucine-tRNA ligase [Microgenomates group bacterium GW2011_GWF1_44_10]KKU01398.1 MAG: Leucine-tRNA ligase [Microgenomates group bacterium GW2011_GWF2_45_18]OGJ41318.1 MAG: leucine--tRNA ligase [Candidatus Pacebacteria bacterium RIFOXYB1_FULL_44_10]